MMKKENDPAVIFEKINELENRYDMAIFQIAKEDMIATILEKAPSKYSAVLTCKQHAKGWVRRFLINMTL
eukprot:13817978-Ditylum_brightwellii.AAC.1